MAFTAARAASSQVDAGLREAREITQRGQADLLQVVDRLMRGEQPAPAVPPPARVTDGDPFRVLASEIEQAQYQTAQGMLRVAGKVHSGRTDQQRVEILVNLARRMQSLVHREIEMLDDLEAQVEDPDLLKGLFTVDHLATRLRRQSESLAVLGGSSSRRQWTRQVTMHEVLRAAVAEVEQYSRVKVVPPVEGVLRGTAVTDVIHLIAELVENATKFSRRNHHQRCCERSTWRPAWRSRSRTADSACSPADQQRMNALLADPTGTDVDETAPRRPHRAVRGRHPGPPPRHPGAAAEQHLRRHAGGRGAAEGAARRGGRPRAARLGTGQPGFRPWPRPSRLRVGCRPCRSAAGQAGLSGCPPAASGCLAAWVAGPRCANQVEATASR